MGSRPAGCHGGFTLVELVASIAVLALASLFLVQVFISADRLAKRASDLDRAVAASSAAIETWKSGTGPMETGGIAPLEGASVEVDGTGGITATSWLDRDMHPVAESAAAYLMTFRVRMDGSLARLTVTVGDPDREAPLCAIEAAEWFGGAEAADE